MPRYFLRLISPVPPPLPLTAQLRMSAELVTLRAERDNLRYTLRATENALSEAHRAAGDAQRRLQQLQQQHSQAQHAQQQQQSQSAAALIWWSLFGDSAGSLPGSGAASSTPSVEEIVQPVQRHLATVSADRDRLEAELGRRVAPCCQCTPSAERSLSLRNAANAF